MTDIDEPMLAQALCEHAQNHGYDHGPHPTVVFDEKPSCSRHRTMAAALLADAAIGRAVRRLTDEGSWKADYTEYMGENDRYFVSIAGIPKGSATGPDLPSAIAAALGDEQ